MITLAGRMHGFVLDELELGTRVAVFLNEENNCGWSAIDDVIYEHDMRGINDLPEDQSSFDSNGEI